MMKVRNQARYKPVESSTQDGRGVRRVAISFDDDMFEHIRSEAERLDVPFNAICRKLIRASMENKKAGN